MEVKIIEGQFEPNKLGMKIGIVGTSFCSALCLVLLFIIGPLSFLCIGPFIALYAYAIYANYMLKYQKLTVTNCRVYGEIRKKEVNLPFDKISCVGLDRKKRITITTASGIIICPSCVNGEAVFSAVNNVLNNRTAYQMGSYIDPQKIEHQESDGSYDVDTELNKYKELLYNQLITQEEIDRIRQELENENTRIRAEIEETKTKLADEQAEKEIISTANNVLTQQNYELQSQILDNQKAISELDRIRQDLENENSKYKTIVVQTESKLTNEQSKNAQLVTENNTLLHINEKLEKKVAATHKAVKTLESKIERAKKAKTVKSTCKKVSVKIGSALRLLVVTIFALGAMVSLISAKYGLAIWYGLMAVTVAPYVYRIIGEKIKFDKPVRIAIEIIVPIIVAITITAF